MTDQFSVLAVGTGNIHRSALADGLPATWARWHLPPELRDSVVVAARAPALPSGSLWVVWRAGSRHPSAPTIDL